MAELYCTAEVVTVESAEAGDAELRGYVDCLGRMCDDSDQAAWDLREVLAQVCGRRADGSGGPCPGAVTGFRGGRCNAAHAVAGKRPAGCH